MISNKSTQLYCFHLDLQFSTFIFDKFMFRYVKEVLSFVYDKARLYGADWGHDRTWCNAAKLFISQVLKLPNDSVACSIMTSPIYSVLHLDTRSMKSKRTNRRVFRVLAREVLRTYIELFPTWTKYDLLSYNPLSPQGMLKYQKLTTPTDTYHQAN